MEAYSTLALCLLSSVIVLTLSWAVYLKTGEASFVDVVWAVLTAIFSIYLLAGNYTVELRFWLLSTMISAWCLRLSTHLIFRLRTTGEDTRYKRMKERWGDKSRKKFFFFFQAQALFAVVFALPFLKAGESGNPINAFDYAGILVWLIGFCVCSISDYQLTRFKLDSSGNMKVCRSGLWKYSRHPNYFGEWMVWTGYSIFGLQTDNGALLLAVPVLLYVMITRVSGSSHIEKAKLRTANAEYTQYINSTSSFFPWFPKKPSLPNNSL